MQNVAGQRQFLARSAGIVARVSTGDDENGDDRSVTEQRHECERACADNDWQITDRYEAVGSASWYRAQLNRPEWSRLQRDIEAGRIGIVVAWEGSRLSRDMKEWIFFLDLCRSARARIYLVVARRVYDPLNNADWRDLISIASDSAHESNKISDRVKRAARANADNGLPHSWTYGYEHTYERRRSRFAMSGQVPREPEASIVREIVRRVGQGHAVSRIAADLTERGITPPAGDRNKAQRWYNQAIRRIAVNPMYVAQRRWRNDDGTITVLAGNWEPIVTMAEHLAAVNVLQGRRVTRIKPGRCVWMLTDLATCAACGDLIRVFGSDEKVYACRQHGSHGERSTGRKGARVPVNDLDLWVEGLIVGRLCKDDVIGSFINADDEKAQAATQEAEELQKAMDEYAAEAADLGLSARSVKQYEDRMMPRIADARKRATELSLPGALRSFSGVIGQMAAVHGLWLTTPVAAKRDIIRALAESVTLSWDATAELADRVTVAWRIAPVVQPGSTGEPVPAAYAAPTWAQVPVLTTS